MIERLVAICMLIIALLFLLMGRTVNGATLIDMGECKITYYCPCWECSRQWGDQTYSGKTARSEHTVAVDPEVFDIGSKLLIDGKVYTAEDIGGGVKGDHVDIFVDTHEETLAGGVKYKDVKVIRR